MDLVARLVEPGLTVCLVREFEALTARRIHDYPRAGESAPPMIVCVAASSRTAAGAGKGRSVLRVGIDALPTLGLSLKITRGNRPNSESLATQTILDSISRSLSTWRGLSYNSSVGTTITAASAACDGRAVRAVPPRGGCSRLGAAPPVSVGRSARRGTGATDAQSA